MENLPKKWTFENQDVAKGFDRHVREQLPWYELTTSAIGLISRHYIQEGTLVYDIGASTGNISLALQETLQERKAQLVAIEPSAAMRHEYHGIGELVGMKAEEFQYKPCSLVVMHLTLQFISPSSRRKLLDQLKQVLLPGGAIILLDKFTSNGGYFGMVTYRMTLDAKIKSGATPDQILRKELSLGGVQRPLDAEDLQGWHLWFKFGDFCGYVFEKR